jgi:hypothetical protein
MTRLKVLLWIVALSQIVLGALTLIAPGPFFVWMGLTAPPANNNYMLGMLAARFLAYGIGMGMLARAERPERFWILNMMLVQIVDFGVGLFYVATGTIGTSVAAFPMFNAALFALLLWLWAPSDEPKRSAVMA